MKKKNKGSINIQYRTCRPNGGTSLQSGFGRNVQLMAPAMILLILLLLPFHAMAQEGEGGTESNMNMGFGARALGLGRAYTALAEDPTAVFWNSAGLEYVYQQSVTFFHTTLFEGTSYDFLGYAYPTLNLGTFGLGIGRIGVGGITQRDYLGNDIGNFSWDEYHGFFSYAKKLPWDVTTGLTVRVIRRGWYNLADEGELNDVGVGMDLGMLYRPDMFQNTLLKNWSLGINVRNLFAPQVKEGVVIDEFPLSIRFGLLRKIAAFGEGNRINLLADMDYSEKRSMRLNMGAEYKFRQMGNLRVGYNGNSVTFGAGASYSIFQIDYAFGQTGYSDIFPAMHRFSLSLNFGLTRVEMREIVERKRKAEEERIIAEIREEDRQRFIEKHMEAGDEYLQNDQYLDAIVEYQQVIGEDPFNSQAQAMLDSAETLLQASLDQEQQVAVQRALDTARAQRNREFIDERFEKGRMFLDKNQFTEALIQFNMALERDPDNTTIQNAIRTTQRRIEEETDRLIGQARQEFQNQNYAEALRLLANARVVGGENEEIQAEIAALTERIKLTENIQSGLKYYDVGQYEQALEVFEKALEIDPDNSLARQYYERSRIETADQDSAMDRATERRYLEGVDKFLAGKYREAIQIWEKILDEYPYNKKVLKAVEGARERLKKTNE